MKTSRSRRFFLFALMGFNKKNIKLKLKNLPYILVFFLCAPSAQSPSPSSSTLHLCFHSASTAKKKKLSAAFWYFCFFAFLAFPLPRFSTFFAVVEVARLSTLPSRSKGDPLAGCVSMCVRGETCVSHKSWHLPDFILHGSECMWDWSCSRYLFWI